MSDVKTDPNYEILVLEQEEKILNAEAAKKSIQLRIAKRARETERDLEHISLQDKVITEAKRKIEDMNP